MIACHSYGQNFVPPGAVRSILTVEASDERSVDEKCARNVETDNVIIMYCFKEESCRC